MARSVKTNYLYNLLYQITAILLPLITMPYVSRVLSPQGVGTNSLTNANTQYFMLLGTLGITMYATKKIATNILGDIFNTIYWLYDFICYFCFSFRIK